MPEYQRKLAELVPPEPISEILRTVKLALGENPYVFGPSILVDAFETVTNIRSVRTRIYLGETGIAPPLVILFGIQEDEKKVFLLDIAQRSGFGLDQADF